MTDPKAFFTSQTRTDGHPDKLFDQISDGELEDLRGQLPEGLRELLSSG